MCGSVFAGTASVFTVSLLWPEECNEPRTFCDLIRDSNSADDETADDDDDDDAVLSLDCVNNAEPSNDVVDAMAAELPRYKYRV